MFLRPIAFALAIASLPMPMRAANPPATPAPAAASKTLERGSLVRVMRNQMMLFYGKPRQLARKGDVFEVLDVRPAAGQVFVAVKDRDQLIALSMPIESVMLEDAAQKKDRIEASTALFAGLIPKLNLVVSPEAIEQLRKEPRNYVEATIEEQGAKPCEHVAIKLKGSVGSFRPIDDRPGFSVNCTKFKAADRFHGLKRFQLNNCAQDGTALNELLAGEMARAAGVPASRCTHALVSLNGRDLGIYVLKEGFTEEFLGAFFKDTSGHLYDGGFCAEVREDMELDRGDEKDKTRLHELVATLSEPDAEKQFQRLSAVVDVDAYLRYLALETIMCHWDGYSFNRNNYRIYENPETGRFHFILHGMDQTFGDATWGVQREPGGQVGAIIMRRPEMRQRYLDVVKEVFTKVIKPRNWPARVEEHGQRLLAALKVANPQLAQDYAPRIDGIRRQVEARMASVRRQLDAPQLTNQIATRGGADLADLNWSAQGENAEWKETNENGRACLYLHATGDTKASWRANLVVPPGKFRLEALMKTRALDAAPGENGDGAGVRISGGSRKGQRALSGTAIWQPMTFEFESPGADVELVLEMRAKAGELWIDRKSLRVTKLR